MLVQSIIPPPNHCRIGQWAGSPDEVPRCPVKRWELHEQPILVASLVNGLYGLFEHGCYDFVVEAGKVDIEFGRIANVIDANPYSHQCLFWVNNMFEDRLTIEQELFRLVDELNGPVVMKREIFNGNVCTPKSEIP